MKIILALLGLALVYLAVSGKAQSFFASLAKGQTIITGKSATSTKAPKSAAPPRYTPPLPPRKVKGR